jgi:hypothetical protein
MYDSLCGLRWPLFLNDEKGVAIMGDLSSILFACPSFIEGAARAFDLSNSMSEYNRSETGELADGRALYADWRLIGDEIRRAMEVFASVQEVDAKK